MKYKHLVISGLVVSSLALSGCWEDNSGTGTEATVQKTGVALSSGYLALATICLDENSNKSCDEAESVKTTTDSNGAFSLDVPESKAGQFAILAEAVANTTSDGDTTVEKKFVLSAPKGDDQSVISPLTTMVDSYAALAAGLSNAEIDNKILTDLGVDTSTVSVSLFDDYLALVTGSPKTSNDAIRYAPTNQTEAFDLFQKIAQVTSLSIQNNIEAAEGAGIVLDETLDSLVILVVNEVVEEIEALTVAIEAAGADFNATTAATLAESFELNIDTLAADLAAQELQNQSVAKSLRDVMAAGIRIVDIEVDFNGSFDEVVYEKEALVLNSNGTTLSWIESDSINRGAFTTFQPAVTDLTLTVANGWVQEDFSSESVIFNDTDGSATVTNPVSDVSFTFTANALDVTDEQVRTLVEGLNSHLLGIASFPTGSEAYQITYENLDDEYYLNGAFQVSSPAIIPTNLNQMINSAATTLLSLDSSINVYRHDGQNFHVEFVAANPGTATSGVVNFYRENAGLAIEKVGSSGSFTIQTVNGEKILTYTIPADVSSQSDFFFDDEETPIFAENTADPSKVFAGELYAAGNIGTVIAFNNTAGDEIDNAWLNPVYPTRTESDILLGSRFNVTVDGTNTIVQKETVFNLGTPNNTFEFRDDTGAIFSSGTWQIVDQVNGSLVEKTFLLENNVDVSSAPVINYSVPSYRDQPLGSRATCTKGQTTSNFLCVRERFTSGLKRVSLKFTNKADADAFVASHANEDF